MYEFYKDYLAINLSDYKNLKIDLQINMVLLGLVIGIIIAAILMGWHRNSMLLLIKTLHNEKCTDENSAKTLSELCIDKLGVRTLIRMSGRVGRLICRVGVKDYTYEEYIVLSQRYSMMKRKKRKKDIEENTRDSSAPSIDGKIDFSTARFYLRDVSSNETKVIIDKTPGSVLSIVLMCVLLISIYTILLLLMPTILEFINSLLAP